MSAESPQKAMPWSLLLGNLGLATQLAWLPGALAQPQRPPLPQPRTVIYQPDEQGCRPELLEAGYRRQLLPFADQSDAVISQLRQLQNELTTNSIRRCQEKGLLSAEEASALSSRLGLPQPITLP
ncbi:MAG: hypothetical protein R6W06_07270 [Prochlorococcaceae cyanobacterium]